MRARAGFDPFAAFDRQPVCGMLALTEQEARLLYALVDDMLGSPPRAAFGPLVELKLKLSAIKGAAGP